MARAVIMNTGGMGLAATELAKAFFPNPADEARAAYMLSGARLHDAQRGLVEMEGQGRQMSGNAASIASTSGVTPTLVSQFMQGATMQGSHGTAPAPNFLLSLRANAPGATPSSLTPAFMGAGGSYANTVQGQTQAQDAAMGRTVYASNSSAGASRDVASIHASATRDSTRARQEDNAAALAQNQRQWEGTPVAGQTPAQPGVPPVPTFATRGAIANGRTNVQPTPSNSEVEGGYLQAYTMPGAPPMPDNVNMALFGRPRTPGAGSAPKPENPMDLNAKALGDIGTAIDAAVGKTLDPNTRQALVMEAARRVRDPASPGFNNVPLAIAGVAQDAGPRLEQTGGTWITGRTYGTPDLGSLFTSGGPNPPVPTPGAGGNSAPAGQRTPPPPTAGMPAPGSIVVQNGVRYRINPDGSGTAVQ